MFQERDTKLERFLPKNQHNQRKPLNFEFWINRELSKSGKVNFLRQKSSDFFFFPSKNTDLGTHYLLLTFVDKINF